MVAFLYKEEIIIINIRFSKLDLDKILKVAKDGVTFNTTPNGIELITINGDNTIKVLSRGEIFENGAVFIGLNVLKSIPKNAYSVEINADTISAGKRKITYNYDESSVILMPEIEVIETNTIPNDIFESIISIDYALAKDNSRPIIQNIFITGNDAVCLNGYRLALRKFNTRFVDTYIHLDVIKLYRKLKNKGTVNTSCNTFYQFFNFENVTISRKLEDAKFINYEALIQTEFRTIVHLEAKEILDVLKSHDEDAPVKIIVEEQNSLSTIVTLPSMTIRDDVTILNKTGEDLTIVAKCKYLCDAFKHYIKPSVSMTNAVSGIFIEEDNKLDLILPIRQTD